MSADRERAPHNPFIHIRRLRDDYSDEIPKEIIRGPVLGPEEKRFKVRINWWQGLLADLGYLQTNGLIPTELIDEVTEFIYYFASDMDNHIKEQERTSAEDIARANELITKILDSQQER